MKFLVIFQKFIRLQNTWSFRKNESPFQEIILLEKLRLKNLSLVDQTHSTFKTSFWILSHIEYFKEFEVNQGVGLNLFPNSCVKIGSAKKFRCAVAFNLKLGIWRATFWFCIDVYPCLPQCVLVSIVWILRSFSKCRSFFDRLSIVIVVSVDRSKKCRSFCRSFEKSVDRSKKHRSFCRSFKKSVDRFFDRWKGVERFVRKCGQNDGLP